jgi:RNA polymerase sigma-70 factor (ECF subfamily)
MRDSPNRDEMMNASFQIRPAAPLISARRRTRTPRPLGPIPARLHERLEAAEARSAPDTARLEAEIVRAMPQLRILALSLCGDPDHADDLVQEAVARGLSRIFLFEDGTNLVGWLFTILRNFHYTDYHKRRRETDDPDGRHAATLIDAPTQEHRIELLDVNRALDALPAEQRDALTLVAIGGHSYEETALLCNCPVGTVRSRISRARSELARMGLGSAGDGAQSTKIYESPEPKRQPTGSSKDKPRLVGRRPKAKAVLPRSTGERAASGERAADYRVRACESRGVDQ